MLALEFGIALHQKHSKNHLKASEYTHTVFALQTRNLKICFWWPRNTVCDTDLTLHGRCSCALTQRDCILNIAGCSEDRGTRTSNDHNHLTHKLFCRFPKYFPLGSFPCKHRNCNLWIQNQHYGASASAPQVKDIQRQHLETGAIMTAVISAVQRRLCQGLRERPTAKSAKSAVMRIMSPGSLVPGCQGAL